MPFKKTIEKCSEEKSRNEKATTKYRRLQTLIKKTVELSEQVGVSLNLLIADQKFNKVTEYHTDD